MLVLRLFIPILSAATAAFAQRADGQWWPCNPTHNATGSCRPNKGLTTSTYSVDFTKQTSLPEDWTISNYATVKYGSNGAEFTFNKRGDAPQIWTNFYMLGCKYEIVAQVAPGTGMISSSVLVSDDFDEIDFEFSGNNFNFSNTNGLGQNNYFGKGITGSYDRGSWFGVSQPMNQFHTYGVDWNYDRVIWYVDGRAIRILNRKDCDNGTHQYPQSPSKLQLGIWDGGDPDTNWGTVQWAGGYTDLSKAPFTFYVKSVKIENYTPACAYNYTDQSGSWGSIRAITDQKVCNSIYGSSTTTSTSTTSKKATSSVTTISATKSTSSSSHSIVQTTSYVTHLPVTTSISYRSTVLVHVTLSPSTVWKTTTVGLPKAPSSSSAQTSSSKLTSSTTKNPSSTSKSSSFTSKYTSTLQNTKTSGSSVATVTLKATSTTKSTTSSRQNAYTSPWYLLGDPVKVDAPSSSSSTTTSHPSYLVSGAPPTGTTSSSPSPLKSSTFKKPSEATTKPSATGTNASTNNYSAWLNHVLSILQDLLRQKPTFTSGTMPSSSSRPKSSGSAVSGGSNSGTSKAAATATAMAKTTAKTTATNQALASIQSDVAELLRKIVPRGERFRSHRQQHQHQHQHHHHHQHRRSAHAGRKNS